ncbi:MAG TPA: hypothetical protein VF669_16625 [Tepidisphaeraceae bacterium]|jgi:hypothetical protein
MRHSIALWCVAVITCCSSWAAAGAPFDWPAFDKLPASDRLDIVLAGMRQHEAALRNLQLKLKEDWTTFGPNGPFHATRSVLLRMKGLQYYCEWERRLGGEFDCKVRVCWDGQVCRLNSTRPSRPYPSGLVQQTETDDLQKIWFNDPLGIRREDSRRTVCDWLKTIINERQIPYSVQSQRIEKRTFIQVSTGGTETLDRDVYFIDPEHDFMIQRYQRFAAENPKQIDRETVVEESRQVGGTFVPWRVRRPQWINGKIYSQLDWEVESLSLEEPKDSELTLDFLPGTHVRDAIEETVYVLQKDGSRKYLPSFNPRTGRIKNVPNRGATASTQPAKDK